MIRARAETGRLFELLSPDALYERPVTDRHRLIFYLGHLEAFDWNMVARRGANASAFHPTFDALFERGIDPEPGGAPMDCSADWPSREAVEQYNSQTRDWIDRHWHNLDPTLLQMAIEHRYMHAETLAYLMHNLPYSKKGHGPIRSYAPAPAPENSLQQHVGGATRLGTPDGHFGWDNEFTAHEVTVAPFRMSKYKVTNGEYLRFVEEAGGTPSHFWRRQGDSWRYRGMFGEIPLPLDHPAWVTWNQAATFAAWRGLTLPTESQFQLAATGHRHGNGNLQHWDSVPVTESLVGNGWEWTRDVFAPFAGFAAHPAYAGYSEDFFDGKHYVLKGASPRTASLLIRQGFRNWYRPDYPHMYAGFHVVEN